MYSHGSSARVGVGKRGHGGREYRPPRKRRDPNATPPPLKECSCLVEIHLPEYQTPQPGGRHHECFGGRQAMERCHSEIRSTYQVHLMIPGKNQQGPVNMVAKSYREAVPALGWLMSQLTTGNTLTRGRFHRNVKDLQEQIIEGNILQKCQSDVYFLFEGLDWSILACDLIDSQRDVAENTCNGLGDSQEATEGLDRAAALQTCLDNIIFKVGKDAIGKLDVFFDDYLERAFAVGNAEQAALLFQEISSCFLSTTTSESDLLE